MPALSARGYLLIIPFLLAMLFRGAIQKNNQGKTYFPAALWTIAIAVCALYFSQMVVDTIKITVARERPCRAIEGIRLIVACPKSFSMPSSHTIMAFAAAIPLFCLTKKLSRSPWRLYPLLLASFIAFSRLYLGAYYPTDVVAGIFLGTVIGMGLSLLYQVINSTGE